MGSPCHMVGSLVLSIEESLRCSGNETQSVSRKGVLQVYRNSVIKSFVIIFVDF